MYIDTKYIDTLSHSQDPSTCRVVEHSILCAKVLDALASHIAAVVIRRTDWIMTENLHLSMIH